MKAIQLRDKLNELISEHGDLELYYGIDDEGNEFKLVHFEAVEGTLVDYEFDEHTDRPTHICIN